MSHVAYASGRAGGRASERGVAWRGECESVEFSYGYVLRVIESFLVSLNMSFRILYSDHLHTPLQCKQQLTSELLFYSYKQKHYIVNKTTKNTTYLTTITENCVNIERER